MPTPTAAPTAAQIQAVQNNLSNLIALNNYIYDQGASSRVTNAY